ncbi:MAG: helix-turn-helix transcriptional regulator [Oscillospiraceae bacterium]|nr:helix-turn-helix transcriptional regulator [Oscillospiraceae bacterium]
MNKENWYYVDEENWKKEFSNTINQLLKEKNVSINKVASAINADPKTLRNYIDCKSIPSAIMIMRLAKYFNVSLDYMTTNGKSDTGYSDETVTELGTLVKNFDVTLEKSKESDDTVILKIKDRIIATIIRELYLTKESMNYDNTVQKLAKYYGKMKVYNNNLVDYDTFQNLISHEYIYHDIEDDIMECVDENGNNCLGIDPYTFDEIQKREDEWEQMTTTERETWWNNYSKKK